ncbi:hypothetical protein EVAR_73434_1 [Eumeta japonica]|uniref:Uncharacterized protein n=1 Tax=Eumeta variegata TaxID=151549 RepID=A0A4C1TG99_EUMVA|nr:hypothetical protein EVAR_73434_1 [Eumeta japonica]
MCLVRFSNILVLLKFKRGYKLPEIKHMGSIDHLSCARSQKGKLNMQHAEERDVFLRKGRSLCRQLVSSIITAVGSMSMHSLEGNVRMSRTYHWRSNTRCGIHPSQEFNGSLAVCSNQNIEIKYCVKRQNVSHFAVLLMADISASKMLQPSSSL